MTKPRIELQKYWKEKDAEADARIAQSVILNAQTEKDMADAWYNYLDEQLTFPFYAYIKEPISKSANTTRSARVKLVRLAERERCGYRNIWLVGYPTYPTDTFSFFFNLEDFLSVEIDIQEYQVIQDSLYWANSLEKS